MRKDETGSTGSRTGRAKVIILVNSYIYPSRDVQLTIGRKGLEHRKEFRAEDSHPHKDE